MSGPWVQSKFRLAPLGRTAEVQLGKMLQPNPNSDGRDAIVWYLRAGSLADLEMLDDLPQMYATQTDLERYNVVSGDLVVAEGGDCGQTAFVPSVPPQTIIQNSLHRVRSRTGDIRFIRYSLDAIYSTEWLDALCSKSTFGHLTREKLVALTVPEPSPAEQRGIANYLDRETARIDALITAKRRMVELLEERWQGVLEVTIQSLAERFGATPLKYVCQEVVVGIVVTPAAWYADSGIPAIRGTNVSPGVISLDDLVYLTAEGHALHPKSRLRSGDVVVVRTGQAGAAAIVPPELDGANCIDLVIIRLSRNYSPHFLEYVLNSDWMQKHIDEHSVGTIQSHFNVGAAGMVPVPLAPCAQQDETVTTLRIERRWVVGMVDVLTRQIDLLQERRQALITAAVTGQLDIQEAA